ncbi:MAG TPA: hypothetical protein VFV80_07440, partial [Geminicoccaceae bacterium]|nr:hypothetical protein [Geminicoccaceae bacterium]
MLLPRPLPALRSLGELLRSLFVLRSLAALLLPRSLSVLRPLALLLRSPAVLRPLALLLRSPAVLRSLALLLRSPAVLRSLLAAVSPDRLGLPAASPPARLSAGVPACCATPCRPPLPARTGSLPARTGSLRPGSLSPRAMVDADAGSSSVRSRDQKDSVAPEGKRCVGSSLACDASSWSGPSLHPTGFGAG